MGTGSSGLRKKQSNFMRMSDDQKVAKINAIISDKTIKVPQTLDDSITTKVLYALGYDGKPKVVDDSTLDTMPGTEIFRTTFDTNKSTGIESQESIKNDKNVPLSSDGTSSYGRAIYYADSFNSSTTYGFMRQNPVVSRAKINPKAKIASTEELGNIRKNNPNIRFNGVGYDDEIALIAITKGYDGWYSKINPTNRMIINRKALTVSKKNKRITSGKKIANTWKEADDW